MFDAQKSIDETVEELRSRIKGRAIVGISGGVDFTTAAILVGKAVGENLQCVLVDTGYMRKNEIEENAEMLKKLRLNVILVCCRDRFYEKLRGVVDPEQKRRIIGELFIKVFEDVAKKENARFFVQGTIAPDWIESGGGLRSIDRLGNICRSFAL